MHSHLSFMSQYSNRLMMMWDTPVSFTINRYCARFIHSFHLISAAARARQASISLSLFFSSPRFYIFYLIPSAQMQKKSEVKIVLFSFLFYTTKKKPIDYQNETTFLIIHSLNNIIHSTKKEKRQVLITNHLTHFLFQSSQMWMYSIYIWSCMRTFPL